nr:porin [Paraburkholderia kururiensis]
MRIGVTFAGMGALRRRWARWMTAAVVFAFSGSACFAQSSNTVVLYGILDTGVEYLNHVGPNERTLIRMPNATGSVPSRLGFSGKEELGGGYSAVFKLESGFGVNNGALGLGGRLFGRQAYVGISSPYGTLQFGRQYTMAYLSQADSDVFGPAIYSVWDLDSYVPNGRADNAIGYLGSFGGLTIGGTYSFGRDTVNAGPSPSGTNCAGQTPGDFQACKEWSLMVKYNADLWGVTTAYDRIHGRSLAGPNDALLPAGLTNSGKTDSRLFVDGYVKISSVKIGVGFMQRSNDGNPHLQTSDLWYLGATYYITPALDLTGQVATLQYRANSDYNSTLAAIRLMYSLSKRTSVYATTGYIHNNSKATVSVSGGAPGSNPAAGVSQAGVTIGLRHLF